MIPIGQNTTAVPDWLQADNASSTSDADAATAAKGAATSDKAIATKAGGRTSQAEKTKSDTIQALTSSAVGAAASAMLPHPSSLASTPVAANQMQVALTTAPVAQNVMVDFASVMNVMLKLAQSVSDGQAMESKNQLNQEMTAQSQAADQLTKYANDSFTASMISATVQIGAGALTAGVSAASMGATLKSVSLGNQAAALPRTAENQVSIAALRGSSQSFAAGGDGLRQAGMGLGQSIQGLGGVASAFADHDAKLDQANSAHLDASAKKFEAGVQDANSLKQKMSDLIQSMIGTLRTVQQGNLDTSRTINNNIA